MTKQEFMEELAIALNEDSGRLSAETALKELEGWDSMNLLSVAALLDGLLDRPLEIDRLQTCQTIHDLVEIVAEKLE